MTDFSQRIAALTPEQRAMFEMLRKKQQQQKKPSGPPQPGPVPQRGAEDALVLSFDQERLWFLHQLDPGDTAYNINTATRMRGPLNLPALSAALDEVVRRHEAWRTTFPAVLGQPAVVIAPSLRVNVPVVDLSGLPEDLREPLALRLGAEELKEAFDLGRGPLLRARLMRVGPDDHFCNLTVHHIVTDWVSFQLFWRELALLYDAFAQGQPSPLPELAVQYADFALWQRGWLREENLQFYLDFWLKELEDYPHALELPTDRPRPATQTTHGAITHLALSTATSDALRALGRKEGATPFMAVLAAWNALLFRYSGQDHILVGSPNANRNRAEIQPLFGFFLTQLAFATDLSGDLSFRELLHRERGTALRAYQHQDLPFGKLIEALRPERDPSRAPLVQVNILLLDAEATVLDLPNLSISLLKLDEEVSRFDITLNLWDSSHGIYGWFEYNTDLFDAATIQQMGDGFVALVEQTVASPDLRLSAVELASPAARHQITAEWNDTAARTGAADVGLTVDRRFEQQAARTPGAVAVVAPSPASLTPDLAITYEELNRRANRLAHHLRKLGVEPDTRVGLCMDRTPELAAGMLGIWKAGGAYVPLDPTYPQDRLDYLIQDAGIGVVVSRLGLPGPPRPGLREVRFDGSGALPDEPEENPAEGRPGPRDLAYVLYTSGTTGRPKGVMVEHGNLISTLDTASVELGWGACDRIAVVAPFSFDIFLFEMWSPLLSGGLAELIPLSPALDVLRLRQALDRATRFHAVPALMRQLATLIRSEGPDPGRFRHVRGLYSGGDAAPPELLADLRELFPAAEVRVLYGPTEATILCSTALADGAERPGALLGRPLDNAYLRLRDANGGDPPIGVVGEVWIGGAGVTRGYLGRPDLTAEKFVEADGRRWYRSGDLARWLPDGTLEFRGRADGQVKVRGFRIEPGEVETALLEQPAVREAVVLARSVDGSEGGSGDRRLVAYLVPQPGAGLETVSEEALRPALAGRLPEYMIPGVFLPLPELPLTAHGKVDRKALLRVEPALARPAREGDHTPPRNPAEEALAAIWKSVLNLDEVGVHDNFFRLGGDSILSIQVVARAREAGLAITPRQLFEHQTIAGLAAIAISPGIAETGEPEEPAEAIAGEAPLTPVQRYFFASDPPEPHHFNQALLLAVLERLDAGRLREDLAALARHHDALRLTYVREGTGPLAWRQVYGPADLAPALLAVDLAALPEERRSAAVEAACAELQTGFDLARGPLFLAALFDFGDSQPGRLFLAAHHLIVDAVSWRILLEDLGAVYAQLAAGAAEPRLPGRSTSWKRWAERLSAYAKSPEARAELSWWAALPASTAPRLPLDLESEGGGGALSREAGEGRGGGDTLAEGGRVSAALSPEATASLLKVAPAAYRTQVNDLLLTALVQAFGRWTGEPRLLLDLEGHGREEIVPGVDLSRTVGWFTTVFPVVLDLAGVTDAGAAIKAVKEQLRQVPNRGIGYGLLRYLGGDPGGRLAALPPAEVSFNYLGQVDGTLAAGPFAPAAEPVGPSESPQARRRHKVAVDALVLEDRLRIDVGFGGGIAPETAERLARGFAAALEGLAAHCAARVARGEVGGWQVPSDFPLARLSSSRLDALLAEQPPGQEAVEDLYPLAPLQGGMLFHSLYEPDSEAYFEQLVCTLDGPLDVDAFARAWQGVVDRHPALRTAFLWQDLDRPLQAVRARAEVPWTLEDWRGVPPEEIKDRLARRAAEERVRGFALDQAPLLRLALLRTAEREHRLLWSFHHLLFDGWCFSLIFGEVLALYEAARAGREAMLPPVRPYRDYTAWLGRQDEAAEEEWWRARLAGFAAPTPLPADRPAPRGGAASHADEYAEIDLRLSPEVAGRLSALAQRLEVTVNNLAQGAWALLLSRLSGERDVVFGIVVSGRPAELPGVESIVGLFINTLPVRVAADPRAPLADWLRELRRAQEELSHHGWNPLNKVQGWSAVPPGEPLFDSLFVFENYPLDPSLGERLSDLKIGDVEISERTTYPLTITAVSRGDFALRAGFDRRFDAVTARRLLGHLETLLAGLLERPDGTLGDIPLLSATERHQLLAEWNPGAARTLGAACLHERFAAQAARTPEAVAVSAGEEALTYGELAERAGRLARRLVAAGVGPEVPVGLFAERSLDLVVGVLGILMAGGAYLPLDPAYPQERLAVITGDAAAKVVVVGGGLEPSPFLASSTVVPLEDVPAPAVDLPAVDPGNAAYVIYTSGSTGKPKGVVVTHANASRLFSATEGRFGFGPGETWTLFHSYAFDFSVWEIWGALLYGGRLVVVPYWVSRSPEAFYRLLAEEQVTVLNQTPSAFGQLLWAEEAVRSADGALPPLALRWVVFGGEALDYPSLAPWFERHGDARPTLVNMYGITETTVHVTWRWVTAADTGRRTAGSLVGRAIPDLALRVLDRDLQPVPAGVPGEIHVGGAGLARGYLDRPALTAERFVPDPFGDPGERLYRSGDLARYRADGDLEHLGRSDHQVKIRGFRIELGEIEAALASHPAVRAAVAVARSGGLGEKRLAGYAAASPGELDAAALRAWLEERLPAYMVPADLTVLAQLPLDGNGKVDRRALPDPEAAPGFSASGAGFLAPRTPAEEALAAIWRGVLGVERVGINDNFFHLGGDSILSIQVVVRARQAGLAITPRQVFEEQTVAALAAVARPLGAEAEQGPVEGEAPLTPVQRFFLDADPVVPDWFNQSVLLELKEPLAPAVAARAVAALAVHHDALRLRFFREGGGWKQVHAPVAEAAPSAPFLLADLSSLPAEERGRAVEESAALLQTGFDLARGPLFLAAQLAMGPGRSDRLLLAVHHLAVDGVSWRVLLEDLETACGQIAAGETVALPPKTTSWKRWAERLAAHARSGEVTAELADWLALADGPPFAPLPVDRPAGLGTVGEAAAVSVALSEETTAAFLREAPQAYRTQVNDLLLTALARAFAHWRPGRLWIDLEGHGREDEIVPGTDLSRTVGWFTTIYPVPLDLEPGAGPGESIKAVKERLRAVPRRGIGYGLLRYLGDPETASRLAALPEPEVAFNYLGQFDRTLGAGARWSPAPEAMGPGQSPRERMRHRIEVNAWVLGDRLHATWSYCSGAYDAATIERLAAGFIAALEELTAHCTAPGAGSFTPSDFPLAHLGAAALDLVVERLGGPQAIEDLYPIAPLQGGMLFHTLYDPASELYHEQLSFAVRGALDPAALRRAWQTVLDRHPALRTAFVWQDVEHPLQAVLRGVELPWEELDWRGIQPEELPARLAEWRATDRARPFDPGRAPLMRGTLLRTGEDEHRFAWSFHHLLFDGWCFALVLREAFVIYEAAVAGGAGREPALPPVRPYRDFLAWLDRQDPAAAERFWRGALSGFAEPNRLPVDFPEADLSAGEPQEVVVDLPRPLVLGLTELAQRREMTVNTVAQGAWAILLSRYTGDRDVIFGTVVAGRPAELPGVESAVGLFINTLPVRVDVDPAARLSAWLRRLQERQVEMRQFEHAPLAEVQRWSEIPPGVPLFESLIAYENYPVDESLGEEGTTALELFDFHVTDRTDYPLSPAFIPSEGGRALGIRFAFDASFDRATVLRMVRQLETLLAGFVAAPEARLADLPFLSAAELAQLTANWAAGGPARGGAVPVHRLFAEQAARRPEAPAVLAGAESLSYGELRERAGRLAAVLRDRGVGPETPVILWAERTPAALIGILGILEAGGAYVPLEPDTPAERVAFVLADLREGAASREPLVLASAGLAARLPQGAGAVLLEEALQAVAAPLQDDGSIADSLAYVIYTSGSTGTPKGVGISHRSLTAYIAAAGDAYEIEPEDRMMLFSSLSFDASVEELFTPLSRGATVVLRAGLIEEPARFLARCREEGTTVLGLPTAYWHQLAAAMQDEGLEAPPALRLVIVGGERARPERWASWGRLAPRVRLVNSYGPTEITVAATLGWHPGGDGGVVAGREVPIGRPVPGARAYVLDEELRPVPVGAAGELYLAGEGIARGYLGRPALTAERFVPDPFAGEPGTRLYRTGDRARWLPDGALEYAGRVDDQVKVRGFRVEPGEIEAVLASHPGVRQAAVVPWKDPAGNVRLVAFVVPRDGHGVPGELDTAFASLPAYMIPSDLLAVSELPVTVSGKIDRRELLRRLRQAVEGGEGAAALRESRLYVAPRNAVEEKLAAIWSDLLGVPQVGAEDDFFALGGHSLSATQLASRLRRDLGVELPLARLFELRRLEDLAREVVNHQLAQEQGGTLDALMADLENLTDEEALALLGDVNAAAEGEAPDV